jgi:hypothetical protein
MVEELRSFLEQSMKSPEVIAPWPPYVLQPERLEERIKYLEGIYNEIGNESIRTGGQLGKARVRAKICFSQLARHVALSLEGRIEAAGWPGFDLGRRPWENGSGKRYRSWDPAAPDQK